MREAANVVERPELPWVSPSSVARPNVVSLDVIAEAARELFSRERGGVCLRFAAMRALHWTRGRARTHANGRDKPPSLSPIPGLSMIQIETRTITPVRARASSLFRRTHWSALARIEQAPGSSSRGKAGLSR